MKGKRHALAVNLALILAVVLIDKVVGDAQRLHVGKVPYPTVGGVAIPYVWNGVDVLAAGGGIAIPYVRSCVV